MPITVQLLLPPYLNNNFLSDEFLIESGSNYFTGKLNLSPDITENKVELKFGIRLTDNNVDYNLRTIKTLQISNDPEFLTSTTAAKIVISDWPYTSDSEDQVTGSETNYIFEINPESFIDPTLSLGSRTTEVGDDLFIVRNWPLSANGGISTVYFHLVAESVDGVLGTYPGNRGAFDQIFWQPESGVRPGIPTVVSRKENFTGKKSVFRFEAAHEGASGLYGTGVARYVGDIIELRGPNTASPAAYVLKTNILTNPSRTLASDYSSTSATTSLQVTPYDNSVSRTFDTGSTTTSSVGVLITGTLNSSDPYRGVSVNSPTGTYVTGTSIQPDLFAQACLSLNNNNDEESHYEVSLRLNIDTLSEKNNTSTCKELEVKIDYQNNGLSSYPVSQIIKRVGTSVTTIQSTTLSKGIIKDLREGGIIELYTGKLKRPGTTSSATFDAKNILKAYFTPYSDHSRSYLLGSATVDAMTDWDGNVQANVLIESKSGELIYEIDELVFGTGRIMLDIDLGDCKTDDIQYDSNVATKTTIGDWAEAVTTNSTWVELSDGSAGDSGTSVDGYYFDANTPVSGVGRSYAEIVSVMPSFSDRTKVVFDYNLVQGQFYVGFTPVTEFAPDTDPESPDIPNTIGSRCESAEAYVSSSDIKPTLLVIFNSVKKKIYISHRRTDGSLSANQEICSYEFASTADPLSENIEIVLSGNSVNSEGLWIVIKKNSQLVGSTFIDQDLPTANMGFGWYVCFGTRSNLDYDIDGSPANLTDSRAYLQNVQIVGLPPKINLKESDLPNQRHFSKSTGGAAYQKPLLGQLLLSGNTDFRDFAYKSNSAIKQYRYFVQEFTPLSRSISAESMYPHLLELLVEDTRSTIEANNFLDGPEIKIFDYEEATTQPSSIGSSVTEWIKGTLATDLSEKNYSGFNVPNNNLIQFDLSNDASEEAPNLVSGQKYLLVVKVPNGINLARANGVEFASTEVFQDYSDVDLEDAGTASGDIQGTGWQLIPCLWFKLFHSYRERYNNVFHKALVHMRVTAESHALVSSDASGLSSPILIDTKGAFGTIDNLSFGGPRILSNTEFERPVVTTVLQPGVRTTILNISANDADSGIMAFRVGKQTDFGRFVWSDWLPWDNYVVRDEDGDPTNEARYVTYLYGSPTTNPDLTVDTYNDDVNNAAQNQGSDGSRDIIVSTMDYAGNISDSYPITVSAQLVALIDTEPPFGSARFIDPDGVVKDFTNSTKAFVEIDATDAVSGVKDFRYKLVDGYGSSAWSPWYHYRGFEQIELLRETASAMAVPVGDSSPPVSEPDTPPGNTLPPGNGGGTDGGGTDGGGTDGGGTDGGGETPVVLQNSGTKRIEFQLRDFGNNILPQSGSWNILSRDTYTSRNDFSALGIQEFPKNILVINSVKWFDTSNNLSVYFSAIKFDEFESPDIVFTPVISWDQESEYAFELTSLATGYYKRKIYLSLNDTVTFRISDTEYTQIESPAVSTGGDEFYIDSTTGYLVVVGTLPLNPIYYAKVIKTEGQIWRWDSNSLERVINMGPLGEKAILSMLPLNYANSTANRILLGSSSGRLWEFDGINISGPIFTATDLSGNRLPISILHVHQFTHEEAPYLYLGTAKKSFVFRVLLSSYSASAWDRLKLEPLYNKNYSLTSATSAYNAIFFGSANGKVFRYSRKINKTNLSAETNNTVELALKKSDIDPYESSVLPVSDITSFANQVVASIGDRPEVHSYVEQLKPIPSNNNEILINFFDHNLTNARLATTGPLTGTSFTFASTTITAKTVGTTTLNSVLDSTALSLNDRILIKNQTTNSGDTARNPIQNGVYTVTSLGTSVATVLTRAMDFEYGMKIKGNTNIEITSGSNANKIFYMNSDDYKIVGSDEIQWSETKTSFEHYKNSWNTLYFGKAFIQDPAAFGAWTFYHDGETNSKNNKDLVFAKTIEDKNSETGYREFISINGIQDKATLFWADTGSDIEQAIKADFTPYCIDFEMRHEFGTGPQSFEIADGNYVTTVDVTKTGVTLTSGTSTVTKTFANKDAVFTPFSVVEQTYPEIGVLKMWNFAKNSTSEDTNPLYPDGYGEASVQGWVAKEYASVEAKTVVSSPTTINVTLATTADLDVTYTLGENAASPGIGAYITYNTTGAKSIDGVVLRRYNYAAPEFLDITLTGTFTTSSKNIVVTNISGVPYGSVTLHGDYSEGNTLYDITNDRIIGVIDTVDYQFQISGNWISITITLVDFPQYNGTNVSMTDQPTQVLVLVKDQATNKKYQNGIYYVETPGSSTVKCKLVRSPLFDERSEMLKNTLAQVGNVSAAQNGATNRNKIYYLVFDEEVNLGVSEINFYYQDPTLLSGTDHYLEVTSVLNNARSGDPLIAVEYFDPFVADTHTYMLVRLKLLIQEGQSINAVTCTTENITLSGTAGTINGVTLASYVGSQILVKTQNDPTENGIYTISAGTWQRTTNATYATAATYLQNYSKISITQGNEAGKNYYLHYADDTIRVGITQLLYHKTIHAPTINLQTYWSEYYAVNNLSDSQAVTTQLVYSDNYYTYMIKPAWLSTVASIYFKFENIKNFSYAVKPKIQIDYVSVLTNSGYATIIREFTPVRLAVYGPDRTNVKLWVGKFEDPLIEQDNFLTQATDLTYVKFGKLSPNTTVLPSSWSWGSFRFSVGHVIPPAVPEVQNFYPSFRFPSAGGSRKLIKHSGSIWCLTDGYYYNVSTDNPDDLCFKAWSYIPDRETWKFESPYTPRLKSDKGLIRPLTAISFRDTLLVSGHIGNISNQKGMPEE